MSIHFEITVVKGGDQYQLLATSEDFVSIAKKFSELTKVFKYCILEVWDRSADGPSYPVIEIESPLTSAFLPRAIAGDPAPRFVITYRDGPEIFSSDSMCDIVTKWNETLVDNEKLQIGLYIDNGSTKPLEVFEMRPDILKNFGPAAKEKTSSMSGNVEMAFVLSTAHMPSSEPDFGHHLICTSMEVAFVAPGRLEDTPEWLVPIIDYADKHEFSYIVFDCDGLEADEFKTYEWEE